MLEVSPIKRRIRRADQPCRSSEPYPTPKPQRDLRGLAGSWRALRIRAQTTGRGGFTAIQREVWPAGGSAHRANVGRSKAKIKNRHVTQLSNILVNGKPIGGLGNP